MFWWCLRFLWLDVGAGPRDKSDLYLSGENSAKELGLELGNQGDNPLTIMILYSLMEALSLWLLHGWTLRVVVMCMFSFYVYWSGNQTCAMLHLVVCSCITVGSLGSYGLLPGKEGSQLHLYVDRINTGARQLLELSSSSFQPTFACFVSYILCDELACLNNSLGSRVTSGEHYLCGSHCM